LYLNCCAFRARKGFSGQHELTVENAEYIRNLPRGPLALDGFQLVHG
jgi:hypothetical protein